MAQTNVSDLSVDSSTAPVGAAGPARKAMRRAASSDWNNKEELKWLQLSCERIGEPMLSSLKRDGAFTIDGRPGLFFQGFEGMLPWPEGMAEAEGMWEEWQWRPGEQQGAYELMQRLSKREDVPAETPQSRLDQQSERDYEFEDEVRRQFGRGLRCRDVDNGPRRRGDRLNEPRGGGHP